MMQVLCMPPITYVDINKTGIHLPNQRNVYTCKQIIEKGRKKKVINNKNSGIENMQTYVERIKQGHIGKKKNQNVAKQKRLKRNHTEYKK